MAMRQPHLFLFLIPILLGLLLVSGCLTGQPVNTVPAAVSMSCLTYYTEDMPPFNYVENGTLQGLSIDLLEAITAKMGDKVSRDQVRLVPWSEGYQAALTGNHTAIFAIARQPGRETSFKWAGPISSVREVLFALPDRGITVRSLADLKGYRIGAVADDLAVQQLREAGVTEDQLVIGNNATALVSKLESGEIDLWAYPEPAGRYFTEQVTGNYYRFSVVYSFPAVDIYYAFSRDVPDSTVRSFQQALDALKQEKDTAGVSAYDRIIGRYDPSVGLGQLQYLTEEWAPYNFAENGNATGISVDILDAVFLNLGVNRTRADVRIVPLADGFRAAQGNNTVLFSIVRTPERENLYKWAGPFTKSGFVIFAPLKRNITLRSPSDLNRYRIGAVRSSIENDLLTSRGVNTSNIIPGADPRELLEMLERGEIDLWATGDLAGRHQMQMTAANPDAYEIVYTLSENEFYFIFSKDVPDRVVDAFRQGLDTVRNKKDSQGISEYERILYRYLGVGCTRQPFTDAAVTDLVNTTSADIEKNAPGTFRRINAGEAPYRDPTNPALYVFVYDENTTFVAHADNPGLVGLNFKGKTDVTGKPLHDEIIDGAKKNGTAWIDYVYINPVETNLYYKTAFCRQTKGSDGKTYYVCSGNFKSCKD
jgi:polar amino acid transport system substrate-binding protein